MATSRPTGPTQRDEALSPTIKQTKQPVPEPVSLPAATVPKYLDVPFEVSWVTGALLVVGSLLTATALGAFPLVGTFGFAELGIWLVADAACGAAFLVAAWGAWHGLRWTRPVMAAGAAGFAVCTLLGPGLAPTTLSRLTGYGVTAEHVTRHNGLGLVAVAALWLVIVFVIRQSFRLAFRQYCATRQRLQAHGAGPPPLPNSYSPRPGLVTAGAILTWVGSFALVLASMDTAMPVFTVRGAPVLEAAAISVVTMALLNAGLLGLTAFGTLRGLPWAWLALLLLCAWNAFNYMGQFLLVRGTTLLSLALVAGPAIVAGCLLSESSSAWMLLLRPAPAPDPAAAGRPADWLARAPYQLLVQPRDTSKRWTSAS